MAALGTQPCNADVVDLLVEAFEENARTHEQQASLQQLLRTISGLQRPGDESHWVVIALDATLRSMIRTGLGGVVDAVLGGTHCPSAQLSRTRLEALAPDGTWG